MERELYKDISYLISWEKEEVGAVASLFLCEVNLVH